MAKSTAVLCRGGGISWREEAHLECLPTVFDELIFRSNTQVKRRFYRAAGINSSGAS
jgi:hypothetical protein